MELQSHPRIVQLRHDVESLPVDEEYRRRLLASLVLYADQIIERPDPPLADSWGDLEALQQVTLGDWNEENIHSMFDQLDKGDMPHAAKPTKPL